MNQTDNWKTLSDGASKQNRWIRNHNFQLKTQLRLNLQMKTPNEEPNWDKPAIEDPN